MATSKTLTPTNVTIQIPEFTDQPDQRVNSNCIDKEADAINSLNTAIGKVANLLVLSVANDNSDTSIADACQRFLNAMGTTNHAVGDLAYASFRYVVNAYKYSDSWATLDLFGYSSIAYHCWKENGTWKTAQLAKKSDLTTQEALAEFTGTSSQSINLSKSADKYALLTVRVYNSNGEVCGVATAPPSLFKNLTYKIFGESSSQWGSFLLANDFASATFNRTSSNTQKISVYGVANV